MNAGGPACTHDLHHGFLPPAQCGAWTLSSLCTTQPTSWLQMVDRMDQGSLPAQVCPNSYPALYGLVQKALFRTHVEGKLKSEIIKVATCPADRCVLAAAGVGSSPWSPATLLCACSCSRPQVALCWTYTVRLDPYWAGLCL